MSYFDLQERERRRMIKKASKESQKMMNETFKKAKAISDNKSCLKQLIIKPLDNKPNDYQEVDKGINASLEHFNTYCVEHDDDFKQMKQLATIQLTELFHSELDRVREETIKACVGVRPEMMEEKTYAGYEFSLTGREWNQALKKWTENINQLSKG